MSWFKDWFGKDYDEIYTDRNPIQAQKQLQFLFSHINLKPNSWIADLGCGKGRHLQILKEKWSNTVGFDLSMYLLLNGNGPRVQADFRSIPLKKNAFTLVGSFFTSFGYLPSKKEDLAVLKEYCSLVEVGGYLFLDIMNPNYITQNLPPDNTLTFPDKTVLQERYFDGECICKNITILKDNQKQIFSEKVRLFTREELETFFSKNHMKIVKIFGNEAGDPFNLASSPRMSLLLQKDSNG